MLLQDVLLRTARGVVVLGLAVAAGAAAADVVQLRDGTRLVGTIRQCTAEKATIDTELLGTLEVARDQITSIQTDQICNVAMVSGDRLVGAIRQRPDAGKPVVETAMGAIPIDIAHIEAIWPKDAPDPAVTALEEAMRAKRPKWSLTAEVGATYKEGNSDIFEARGRVEAQRKSDVDLMKLWVEGEYAEEQEVRSAAEVKGGAYYEHLIGQRFFLYGRNEYEYDEFEELDLRAILAAGGGYYFIKQDDHELKARAGMAYQHESFMDGRTTDEPSLDVGLDYRVDLASWLRFTHAATWLPSFEDFGDYRLVFDNALLIPITKDKRWQLKLGALYEYDSRPQPGVEDLDQTYYAGIVLNIE